MRLSSLPLRFSSRLNVKVEIDHESEFLWLVSDLMGKIDRIFFLSYN